MAKLVTVLSLALLIITCTVEFVAGGECNSYEREKLNEGYRTCVYKDSMGVPTIGVGFNLKKFGARGEIEAVGADYDKVLVGTECLNDRQIQELFEKDMGSAVGCASSFVSNYGSIGDGPQSALADMAFNLGCEQLREFTTLKSDVERKDFSAAAQDMKSSLWCRQVGGRCDRDASCMKSGFNNTTLEQQRQDNGIL